ncbi:MAG: HEAT repeat domain-containing protein [Planctomycetes bacterium]|nr:HEAT repeat domain-containing protein [Planctomycetota bacterium]
MRTQITVWLALAGLFLIFADSKASARGSDWEAEFNRVWNQHTPEAYMQAIEKLKEVNNEGAARKLVEIIRGSVVVMTREEEARLAENEQWRQRVGVNSQEVLDEYNRRRAEDAELQTKIAQKRAAADTAREALKFMTEAGAQEYLYKRALGDRSVDVLKAVLEALGYMRVEAAYETLMGRRGPVANDSPGVRICTINALAAIANIECIPVIESKVKDDPVWQVRLAAAQALAKLESYSSIPVIVERMQEEAGRMVHDMDAVLKKLTGQSFAGQKDLWKTWLEGAIPRIQDGTFRPTTSGAAPPPADNRNTNFYGIPIISTKIMLIVDTSGSMGPDPQQGGGTNFEQMVLPEYQGRPSITLGKTKMDRAKFELVTTIRRLPEETFFNIITFANDVTFFQPGRMLTATPDVKNRAEQWILERQASGGTNIYDSIKRAFFLSDNVNPESNDAYNNAIDTIFFVTDGEPSAGEKTSPQAIFDDIQKWNSTRNVVINTIEIGMQMAQDISDRNNGGQHAVRLLEAIALTSGGEWRLY